MLERREGFMAVVIENKSMEGFSFLVGGTS
jgi:hypothetical protein